MVEYVTSGQHFVDSYFRCSPSDPYPIANTVVRKSSKYAAGRVK